MRWNIKIIWNNHYKIWNKFKCTWKFLGDIIKETNDILKN